MSKPQRQLVIPFESLSQETTGSSQSEAEATLISLDDDTPEESCIGPNYKRRRGGASTKPHKAWSCFAKIGDTAKCNYCAAVVAGRPGYAMREHLLRCKEAKRDASLNLSEIYGDTITDSVYKSLKLEQHIVTFSTSVAKSLLCNAIISTGSPFRFLDDEHVKKFLKYLNPRYQHVSRHEFTVKLLPQYTELVNKETADIIQSEAYVSVCVDGWTSRANESLYGITVVTPSGQELLYDVLQLGSTSATATYLFERLKSVFNEIGSEKIAAIVTDGAANMVRLRQFTSEAYRGTMNVYCIIHGLNLLCGSFIKCSELSDLFARVSRLVQFINKSAKTTTRLLEVSSQLGKSPVRLASISSTRFTANYECIRTLLANKESLIAICDDRNSDLPAQIRTIVADVSFWYKTKSLFNLFRPLTGAIVKLQGSTVRISEAAVIGFRLVHQTVTQMSQVEGAFEASTVKHIEKCCERMIQRHVDRSLNLLALSLDPRFDVRLNENAYKRTRDRLKTIILEAGGDEGIQTSVLSDYDRYLSRCASESAEPLEFWRKQHSFPSLAPCAIKIFSLASSSMSCERAFSTMGWINSQRRSRLLPVHIVDCAKVHRFLVDRRIRNGKLVDTKGTSIPSIEEEEEKDTNKEDTDEEIIENEMIPIEENQDVVCVDGPRPKVLKKIIRLFATDAEYVAFMFAENREDISLPGIYQSRFNPQILSLKGFAPVRGL